MLVDQELIDVFFAFLIAIVRSEDPVKQNPQSLFLRHLGVILEDEQIAEWFGIASDRIELQHYVGGGMFPAVEDLLLSDLPEVDICELGPPLAASVFSK